jgi:hypothetical protein
VRALTATAVLIMSLSPVPAIAHATIPGLNVAYAALFHALTAAPAPLALLGLGLLLGMHGAQVLKWAWAAFFLAMIAGVGGTLILRAFVDPELPMLAIALAAALWAASALPLHGAVAALAGAIAGYAFGIFIAPSPASLSTQAHAVVGGLIGANFALVFVVAAVDTIRKRWTMPWVTIGLRVLAAWIAAIAALMAALSAR